MNLLIFLSNNCAYKFAHLHKFLAAAHANKPSNKTSNIYKNIKKNN